MGGFQLKNSNESKKIFDQIPTDIKIDILISHGPPYRILDKTLKGSHVGDNYLYSKVINEIKPKVMIFGHIHESFGIYQSDNIDTTFINAAQHHGIHLKNKSNQPIVFEFEK